MTDYTHEITALQRARIDMQAEKANTRTTIKAKYAERIRQEIEDTNQAAELTFARLLAEAHSSGVPQSLLRSEVLRTNVWSRWVYWRDLAEIQPDRVMFEDARKARAIANAPLQFSDDRLTLTVVKDSKGRELTTPVVFDLNTLRQVPRVGWWPNSGTPEQNGVSIAEREAKKQDPGFLAFLNEEIQRAIDNGTIDNPDQRA